MFFFRSVSLVALVAALGALASPVPQVAPEVPAEKRGGTGKITWYTPGLGSCGGVDGEGDMILAVAMSYGLKHCGHKVTIKANGKSVQATVKDSCEGCEANHFDVSPAVFKALVPASQGGLGKGVQNVQWSFN